MRTDTTTTELLPGTEVQTRGLRWEIVFSQKLGPQTLFRLRGLEGAIRGEELDILHPFEPMTPVMHELRPEKAAPLRNWLVYHQAFLLEQALGPDALLAVQPGRLRIEPYQLVPVLRALRMSRPRLFLADGVGLGKTIQAGLILTELIARRIAHRILVVSPAGPLLDQWKMEMRERFGLRLDVIDRTRLEEIRKSTELGANPFDHIPLGLVSMDFLKQERILDQMERTTYDVIVLDEAHHYMDLGVASDREDSQRRRMAQVLARRCDAFLLLTATPHDGNDRSFASLCELLDPSLVDGRGILRGERYRTHVVRRLKKHIKHSETGLPLFKERKVIPIRVTVDPAKHPKFIELQKTLIDLIAPELRRAFRARRYNDVLSFIALLKRSVSTVAACHGTLRVVAERFQRILTESEESQEGKRQRLNTLRDYRRKLERLGTITQEEEEESSLLEAEDLAQHLAGIQREIRSGSYHLKRTSDVFNALRELIRISEEALSQDPKLDQLIDEIQEIRQQEPGASILVYTEYIASQQAAVTALEKTGIGNILTMSGNDDEKQRSTVTQAFCSKDKQILISTDAAAEGLNLHARSHHLIHLELPFNPNRLEQRNGRIDRYGQTNDPIVRYFYLRGTFEERILIRLIAKYENQRARLTFVPNTLGMITSSDAVSERLLKGLLDEDARLFQEEKSTFDFTNSDEDEGVNEATRELLEEIDRSLKGFEKAARTHTWLGDAGLNAEERLRNDAGNALNRGSVMGVIDVPQFVVDAILLDGGSLSGRLTDEIFTVALPPTWHFGLEEMPGYDPQSRTIRLTNRMEVLQDDQQRPVGFLGRAHPLVKRALDRVRNLSFGDSAGTGLETRVSAVTARAAEPALLFTFIGRVESQAGRELERILAVEVNPAGTLKFHTDAQAWLSLANTNCAIRTTDIWKNHFESWGSKFSDNAHEIAQERFLDLVAVFEKAHRQNLETELRELDRWIDQRSRELTGEIVSLPVQIGLFDTNKDILEKTPPSSFDWSSNKEPAERLAAFANDRIQIHSKRSEADGILRLYDERRQDIQDRLSLGTPEVVPLGMLMIVPEDRHGV